MWTKTRKILQDRLSNSLKRRVNFVCNTNKTNKNRSKDWYTENIFFQIKVDKETWFSTDYLDLIFPIHNRINHKIANYNDDIFFKEGEYYSIFNVIHHYITDYSIDDCLNNPNHLYFMFAIMDRRVGKKRVREIYNNINSYPIWLRRFIKLRAEAENLNKIPEA